MEGITFERARAEYLLDCLRTGKPIEPVDREWDRERLLAVAGACFYLMSHDGSQVKDKATDADYQQSLEELTTAVHIVSSQTMLVDQGIHAQCFEPRVRIMISKEGSELKTRFVFGYNGE